MVTLLLCDNALFALDSCIILQSPVVANIFVDDPADDNQTSLFAPPPKILLQTPVSYVNLYVTGFGIVATA